MRNIKRRIVVPAGVKRWLRPIRTACGIVTPLGRTILGFGFLAWIAGGVLGWHELLVAASAALVLVIVACAFVVTRPALKCFVSFEPQRVVAGEAVAGEVKVTNRSTRRSLPATVELPVGGEMVVFDVPSLTASGVVDDVFVVHADKRGVIPIGPATSVRADPIGLLHREVPSSKAYELIVHPRTVALEPFGSGLLRDLEGRATRDLSTSDLAFHALRDYAPGDDRRYVHWRSSARAGRLLVRQFHDTRRSTLCVIVDGRTSSYADPNEFETAAEVAGSLTVRACKDQLSSTLLASTCKAEGSRPQVLLDALARAALSQSIPAVEAQVTRVIAEGAQVSYGVLVSGSAVTPKELQRAASRFPLDVTTLVVRVAPTEKSSIRPGGRAPLLSLAKVEDLRGLLMSELSV